jgi:SpoVK/Ycf46/Vps4 family AAA+-type ATPase
VTDDHDRYANQVIDYLLQRIEAFEGVMILASNLKPKLDPAILKRFRVVA